jgi:hypothetical protein
MNAENGDMKPGRPDLNKGTPNAALIVPFKALDLDSADKRKRMTLT